ncbi:MAG TPA: NAD-glutamate dehydrogenase [Nocardioides sp.]|uniref:NAD-glutamate dehydrogenase n=1 Tax=Nocardioides sp. TaxID=35761 RepID=UPI002D7E90AE|nr:NAD-glutamate dehydrogenase [Nocardioides sp.]HET6654114.1 NAD-glutamate dehydrogenase [Nocardioides sp.]
MRTTLEETKDDLIERAASLATHRKGSGAPPGEAATQLLKIFYKHVAPEDINDRSEVDLYGGAMAQYKLAANRPQGTANIRVFTPTVSEHGWSAGGHTVVEVVTDDMPFLVDSVTMELTERSRDVHMVVHPQLLVRRDVTGELKEVLVDDEMTPSADLPHDVFRESWMHIEIDRESSPEQITELEQSLAKVLLDVREAVEDWERMRAQAREIVAELDREPPPLPDDEIEEGKALLEWLADDHFTFLGYREYRLEGEGDEVVLRAVPGTGFGILRSDQDMSTSFGKLPPIVRAKAREKTLLVLAKANSKATVHRPVYLDYIGVKTFDKDGEVVGERRFLGLFSSAAYTESLTRIPVIRQKAQEVIDRAGFEPLSHTGKALMDVLETYPRDELFQTPIDELVPIAEAVLHTRERRQLRLFVRRDTYDRYLSCLVYLPRDRYTTAVRERIAAILKAQLGGESLEYTARVSESMLARLHFVVRPPKGELIGDFDQEDLERRLAEAARSWRDDLVSAVHAEYGEEEGARLSRAYAEAFPEAYKEDYPPRTGAVDLGRIEGIEGDEGVALSFYQLMDSGPLEARLKVFRVGRPLSLSNVLPVLSSMGVEVIDERPYDLVGLDRESHIYDFGLRYTKPLPAAGRELFQDAVNAVWEDRNEIDGFNGLVLAAGLTWRQATLLRAYAKYMRQGGTPFAQDYIEGALKQNVDITRYLVELFEARFDPGRTGDMPSDAEARVARCEELEGRIHKALDDVVSLDHDRILRSYLTVLEATLRTNYFQVAADGRPKPYISFKIQPDRIPELPQPRPKFEIFVYSPRVEGVHLRFGAVARGGLRWSDRRDDFRTEVLGLVKAQMVKNAVIVPVGAKGGFFCKQLPDPSDREAWLAEGVACYKTFISGMLDITDNLVAEATVPPDHVVRHDGDDAYLVVAADKGTATFSDIANGVARDYGFWLGDAFASGGSVGYDHKAMGITARGAWESVRRHFRERGIDCQAEDFTCVGVGDMSGDVFGNGMLLSEHIRLVAAFDHRDIFLDPTPDAAASYVERRRLFDLPRSSWQDYDRSLVSEGGGVFPRSAKSIKITPQVRQALSLDGSVTSMTPAELMRAILLADVDLLWNGGIGTYVKATSETDAEVGDKANDPIRVNGGDLRCKAVGEGGNLGLTQRGRIEYARNGGRINTDFIDNSAGVDTSDHEVNIKILLDQVVANGDLTEKQRNDLLASMTDEVGRLVLADNYEQNIALASAVRNAVPLLHVHEDWIRRLERAGLMDRELEALPSRKTMNTLRERKEGLTVPELSVLLAYTKIVLADELLATDLADDPFLRSDLFSYFPSPMRQTYRERMEAHPLRREIVITQVVNDLVNGAGITFFHRLSEETGATVDELVRANFVAREIFGSRALIDEVCAHDNSIPADVQTHMRLEMRTLVERASRWLINNRRPPLASEATVDFFGVVGQQVVQALPELLTGRELAAFESRRDVLVGQGVPEDLAVRVAVLPPAYAALSIVETAKRDDLDPLEVARVHFALGERLGLSALVARILSLPRDDRWQTMARAALRDDLHTVHAQLTAQVLGETAAGQPAPVRIADWEEDDEVVVSRAVGTLDEICADDSADLARLSVGLRVVRTMLATP